jgi:predicted outer membrane repeat protein
MNEQTDIIDLFSSKKHFLDPSIYGTYRVVNDRDSFPNNFKTVITNVSDSKNLIVKISNKGWIISPLCSINIKYDGTEWTRYNKICKNLSDHTESNNIIYVNASNNKLPQTGNSWCDAFSDLQQALDKAATFTNSEIWIAKGIYIPSKLYTPIGDMGPVPGGAAGVTSPYMFTFNIPNNTILYGGFSGKKSQKCERNPLVNRTILSGANSSWHVIILGNDVNKTGVTAKFDGLTITQGIAQGPISNNTIVAPFIYAHSYGGGIYSIFGSSLYLENCLLENNIASGILNGSSDGVGGAIWSINSDLHISKCLIKNNFANQQAGGVAFYNTYQGDNYNKGLISECIFSHGNTALFGGAIVAEGTFANKKSICEIKSCKFTNNSAQEGGAIVIDSLQTSLIDSEFINNVSFVSAGAVATTNVVNTIAAGINNPPVEPKFFATTIENCIFKKNLTLGSLELHNVLLGGPSQGIDFPLGGGAVVCYINGILKINNSKFKNNEARNSDGGAILNGRSALRSFQGTELSGFSVNTTIKKCDFIANKAVNGGAIASKPSTYPFIPPLPITSNDTVLNVKRSLFKKNKAILKGGAIYLDRTTANLQNNCFERNKATEGQNIYTEEQ